MRALSLPLRGRVIVVNTAVTPPFAREGTMSLYELAKQIVCSIIAVALSMTVAAVEGLLPHRPDWLERVEHLAIRLRAVASRSTATASEPRPGQAGPDDASANLAEEPELLQVDSDRLLRAYNQLWQFVHNLRSEGLSLDENFCERVEREWSVTTLLTYMRNADKSLQDHAGKALESATELLSIARRDHA
jgi:hypothetical protein